jgi:type IV secretion system protein TrbL
MQQSFASGARSSFANTGGSSTMGAVGGGEPSNGASPPQTPSGASESGPPAWAQRMKHNRAMSRGAQTAVQALKSGDSYGGGHSVDLSGGE